MLKICLLILVLATSQQCFADSQDASYPQADIGATHGEGTIQIDSKLESEYFQVGIPIQGYVTIIHNTEKIIDPSSFRLGNKPLQIRLATKNALTSDGKVWKTIYQFQIEGMKSGIYNLPSIRVNISGKEYLAIPLTIIIRE